MRIVIEDNVPESLNKTLRMHWAVRRKYNQKWYDLVRTGVVPSRRKPRGRMRVIVSQMRKRLLDKDNLYGSAKVCVDGLVRCGVLVDDSTEHIDLEVRQQKGKCKFTVIDIEPVEGN